MAKVILICGPIAAGKTTYAKKLAERGGVILSMDQLMLALFPPQLGDRHDEIAGKCRRYLLDRAVEISRAGTDVILDWGFWTQADRRAVSEFFRDRGIDVRWHYVKASPEALDKHIEKRNREVEMGKSDAYFVDENLKRKCLDRFECPAEGETDVVYESL